MKIVALLAVILLSIAFIVSPVHATATKLYVSPLSTIAGKVGKTFIVDIAVSGVTNLYGFEFKLSYNTTLLDAKTLTQGPLLPTGPTKSYVFKNQINDTAGYVWFAVSLLAPEPAKTGSGILASITFNTTYGIAHPQTVGCDLHLYNTTLGNSVGQEIAHDTIDGYYAFIPILGDINGDGVVNMLDLMTIALAFGSQPGDLNWNSSCDLNSDNKISVLDCITAAINFGMTG